MTRLFVVALAFGVFTLVATGVGIARRLPYQFGGTGSPDSVAHPVETVESRALHLPLQHRLLVPKHQELDVLLVWSATSGSQETADQEVHEREQHEAPAGRGERMLPVAQTTNRGN